MSEPNEIVYEPRYECKRCEQQITAPGVGHKPDCKSLVDYAEYLQYTPEPYVIKDGKYYLNLAGGHAMTRRIPK